MNIEEHAKTLQKLIQGRVKVNEPMKYHTTFRIGGPADILVLPENIYDIEQIINYAKTNDISYYRIGNGSNILVSDNGIRGIVIKIWKNIGAVKVDGNIIRAEAGVPLPKLSRIAAEQSLSGLEYAVGIPGTLGGAVAMNAGTSVSDTSQVLISVKAMTSEGNIIQISKNDVDFGNRKSRFTNSNEIVLEADLQLQYSEGDLIKEKMRSIIEKRKKTMPLKYPSCGSVFKKPEGDYAGRLIEQAGCKGMRIGDAQVSELHANWIINLGNATFSDVIALIEKIQNLVYKKFMIALQQEVIIL